MWIPEVEGGDVAGEKTRPEREWAIIRRVDWGSSNFSVSGDDDLVIMESENCGFVA